MFADNVGTYQVNWPGRPGHIQLKVEPEHLWVDQGHTSNGVAGYGFFLGLFGVYVAWRQRKRQNRVRSYQSSIHRRTNDTQGPSKTLLALSIMQLLAILFTLSAFIFVFVVTYQTNNQRILVSIAQSDVAYPADKWTPETWFKAVLDLPLARQDQRDNISDKVRNMVAWRWMLIPIFLADVLAFGVSVVEVLRQRKGTERSESVVEK